MPVIETWSDDDLEYQDADQEQVEAIQEDGLTEVQDSEPETQVLETEVEAETMPETCEPETLAESADLPIDRDRDFRIRIWNAEMRCRGKESILEDLKRQVKDAKEELDKAIEDLRRLANECNHEMPLFDNQAKVGEAFEPGEAVDQPLDESWRQRNFIEFIEMKGISGLGRKKLDALAEAVPTFGDFEDLRTRASSENVHLSKLMPDGFGPKVTEEIEEAYLECQWSDSVEWQGTNSNDHPEDDDPETDELPDNEPDPADSEDIDLDSL